MKPVYENQSALEQTTESRSTERAGHTSWLARLSVGLMFVAIAVAGFGSSLGWFDGLFGNKGHKSLRSLVAKSSSATPPTDGRTDPSNKSAAGDGRDQAAGMDGTGAAPPQFSPPPLSPLPPSDSAGILAEGRRVIEHMVQEMPDSVEAKEILARFEYNFGDLEAASRLWRQILDANPNFVYAMRGLGDVATEQGQLQEAVKYFRMAVLADPQNLSRQVTLGVALLTAGQLEEARDVLQAVVNKKDDYVEAHVELASVLLQMEQWDAAREHFERALELAPKQPEVHFGLVKAYSHLGMRDKAREHLALHKKYQGEFTALREQGRRTYDDAEAMKIDVARLYVDMARLYLARRSPQHAQLLLVRASRMDPQNVDARQALAWLATSQGRLFDAVRWLTEIARLQPEQFAYVQEIARLLVQANRPDRAEKVLLEFHAIHPDHPAALQVLTDYYLTVAGDPAKAAQYAKRLSEVAPNATTYALLGNVMQQIGNREEAIEAYEKAAELDPDNVSYRQVAALLREELIGGAGTEDGASSETEQDPTGTSDSDSTNATPNSTTEDNAAGRQPAGASESTSSTRPLPPDAP